MPLSVVLYFIRSVFTLYVCMFYIVCRLYDIFLRNISWIVLARLLPSFCFVSLYIFCCWVFMAFFSHSHQTSTTVLFIFICICVYKCAYLCVCECECVYLHVECVMCCLHEAPFLSLSVSMHRCIGRYLHKHQFICATPCAVHIIRLLYMYMYVYILCFGAVCIVWMSACISI